MSTYDDEHGLGGICPKCGMQLGAGQSECPSVKNCSRRSGQRQAKREADDLRARLAEVEREFNTLSRWLAEVEAQRDAEKQRADRAEANWREAAKFAEKMLTGEAEPLAALRRECDAEKQRADEYHQSLARQSALLHEVEQRADRAEAEILDAKDTAHRHGVARKHANGKLKSLIQMVADGLHSLSFTEEALKNMTKDRDRHRTACAQLRAALDKLLGGMIRTHGDEENGETLYSAHIADVAAARAALASTEVTR